MGGKNAVRQPEVKTKPVPSPFSHGRNNRLAGHPPRNDGLGTACKYPAAQYTPLSVSLSPPSPFALCYRKRRKNKTEMSGKRQTTPPWKQQQQKKKKKKKEGRKKEKRQALSTHRLFKSWFIDRKEQLYASHSRRKPFFLLPFLLLLLPFFVVVVVVRDQERVKVEVRWPSWDPRP